MFILSKRNVIIPGPDGGYRILKDYIGQVPDWVGRTPYFAQLVKDGKIVVTEKTDKAVQDAAEKPVRKRKTTED